MLLQTEGFEAKGVYRGLQVLDSLKTFNPDVVLVDIAMPDLSGFDVARAVRDACGLGKPVLIAISGRFKQGADQILSTLAGFDHHLGKPFEPQALLGLLAQYRAASTPS